MQDRVPADIGAPGPAIISETPEQAAALDWDAIDWAIVNHRVRNLRQRIYRATAEGRWNQVRSLKKLMMRSYANLLLSTRRVTMDNHGKHTAGLDGQTALTTKARAQIVREMPEYTPGQVQPARRVYVPKANCKQRPIGIQTLKDRIAQAVIKNALEPSWEARFEPNSYGFRPGRNCHDAIEQCWNWYKGTNGHRFLLDADIRGAFDNLSQDYILNAIGQTPGRAWIKAWLRAGYVEAEIFHPTESGTSQGSVVSPLLANIALDGMERWLSQWTNLRTYTNTNGKEVGRVHRQANPRYGYVRFADDFIITAATREEIEAIQPHVIAWLAERGLELNAEKTHIRNIADGFDFLGFQIRRYGTKCLVQPQPEKVRAKLRELKQWLTTHPHVGPDDVIAVLNPILRGWANYYKHGVSKDMFATFSHRMVLLLMRWARRRHPGKGGRWVIPRYFTRVGGNHWVFYAKTHNRHGKPQTTYLYQIGRTPITRHIQVRGGASPDDPALADYWTARQTKNGKSYFALGSKLYRVAASQQWTCPACRMHLFNGERIHIHHEQRVAEGGTDEEENLGILHETCHCATFGRRPKVPSGEA